MNSRSLARWGPLLAVVLFSLVGGYALETAADNNAQELRNAVVESCERVNELRKETNIQTEVVKDVVTFIADIAAERGDVMHAQQYRGYVDDMHTLQLVECEEVFPTFSIAGEIQ